MMSCMFVLPSCTFTHSDTNSCRVVFRCLCDRFIDNRSFLFFCGLSRYFACTLFVNFSVCCNSRYILRWLAYAYFCFHGRGWGPGATKWDSITLFKTSVCIKTILKSILHLLERFCANSISNKVFSGFRNLHYLSLERTALEPTFSAKVLL